MFNGCTRLLFTKGLENWQTSNIIKIYYMLGDCTSLYFLHVKDMISIFNNTEIKNGPSNFKYSK